jgi:hypothetical protein
MTSVSSVSTDTAPLVGLRLRTDGQPLTTCSFFSRGFVKGGLKTPTRRVSVLTLLTLLTPPPANAERGIST